ncbi:natural cytotoxicity triggering receptor 2-like isoform X2 [Tamandua tetradactyla]|uniref:natural cytotoxicity triggering receptor 2-like isoform X2 n=1 Tax=Tamandua tetradactyla TaxID=48850 RepID=UPI004053C8F6
MAWETSHLPLILLLLVSGSWAWRPEAEKKRAVAGQAVSVSCPYAHRGGPYKFKTLCRKKLLQCPRLVTAFKPRTLIRASRYTVWDDPDSGFFNVTITKLKVRDSGSYWCATLNSSMRITKILKNIRLVVIPERRLGPVSTKDYEPSPLFSVLYGLLTAKSLLLSALGVLLHCRWHWGCRGCKNAGGAVA